MMDILIARLGHGQRGSRAAGVDVAVKDIVAEVVELYVIGSLSFLPSPSLDVRIRLFCSYKDDLALHAVTAV